MPCPDCHVAAVQVLLSAGSRTGSVPAWMPGSRSASQRLPGHDEGEAGARAFLEDSRHTVPRGGPGRRAVLQLGLLAIAAAAIPGQAWAWRGDRVPRSHGPATRKVVASATREKPGTILISTADRTLDLVLAPGKVARYAIGVGRDGFVWRGTVKVGRKAEWPDWRPPAEMLARDPSLPESVPPGPYNPLGARAIYLYKGGADTLYRIHGTNDADSVGGFVSSGCFRMTNADVLELYEKVEVGAKVIVE
jgi:lipoprotein-anchoring transpeptidase ErfK/SrfK